MKRFILLCLALCASHAALATTTNFPIIDSTVCQSRGSYLYNCNAGSAHHGLTQTYDYVPLETHIQLAVSGTCAVSHINLNVHGDGRLIDSRSLTASPAFTVDQAGYANIDVSVTPFGSYYSYACVAGATVTSDVVNHPKLTNNLRERKAQSTEQWNLLVELIEAQRLVLSLNAAVDALLAVVALAETEIQDYSELSTLLEGACANNAEGEECSWMATMFLITENSEELSFAEQFLLFQLGQHLDSLIQAQCTEEDCDLSLIDDETRALIASIQEEVPDDTDIEAKMAANIVRKGEVEGQIAEYQAVAAHYEIDWQSL